MFPERNWYYVLTKRSMHVKSKLKQMNLIIQIINLLCVCPLS